jgi:hypothetical protein
MSTVLLDITISIASNRYMLIAICDKSSRNYIIQRGCTFQGKAFRLGAFQSLHDGHQDAVLGVELVVEVCIADLERSLKPSIPHAVGLRLVLFGGQHGRCQYDRVLTMVEVVRPFGEHVRTHALASRERLVSQLHAVEKPGNSTYITHKYGTLH